MRRDKFGLAYCATAIEVEEALEEAGVTAEDVHVPEIIEPEDTNRNWTAEIIRNDDGDTVCYIELPGLEEVRAVINQLHLENDSGR